jgi:eukaryotic-like serine/threonine-protein kinase
LYNLGLDFERKRMFEKALMVYRIINKYGPFKDIDKRSARLAAPDGSVALPVTGGTVEPPPFDGRQ